MRNSEIKGLVVGTKNDNAILVIQPDGNTAIATSEDKLFRHVVAGLAQGDWVCVHGKSETEGSIRRFGKNVHINIGEVCNLNDGVMRLFCTNYCNAEASSGWCHETSQDDWARLSERHRQACLAVQKMEVA